MQTISLRGVRVHNLKSIDVEIPLGKLTAIVGVAGSGKSSLVFDTLYAESQRRYLQSFSAYTRQFLERFDQPEAEFIGPLPPAVAIGRSPMRAPARATIGALTEIDDPLRRLFAQAGTLVCPDCGTTVTAQRASHVFAELAKLPPGARVSVSFAETAPATTEQAAWRASLLEEGYVRILSGAQVHRLDEAAAPVFAPGAEVWIVVDRIEAGKTDAARVREAVEIAFRKGAGRVGLSAEKDHLVFDRRHHCPRCSRVFSEPQPRLFDCQDPLGRCPACIGTGRQGKPEMMCSDCKGRCWNADARAFKLVDRTIADWNELPLIELASLVRALPSGANPKISILIEKITTSLDALTGLDLGHLTLGQPAAAMSDGAAKRLAIASALAASLVHVLYLLDEPGAGMHPCDTPRLVAALHTLRDRGNTIVVIDNDRAMVAAADHAIELGPGAGYEGGYVVYQGPPAGLPLPAAEITIPPRRRKAASMLKLAGIHVNNLRDVNVEIPLGVLCAVVGVTGAGKRSLVVDTLVAAFAASKKKDAATATSVKLRGGDSVRDVVLLDQQPMPRGSRSNPATYLKLFDEIRELFAQVADAKIRNFGPGHFSFNQPAGRCETCQGEGTLTMDMQFLAGVTATCPACHGQRYRREILEIKVRSRSIAEVLDLTIREAFRFFRAQPGIEKKLKPLLDTGLDYLRLGQALETLSGSECQRLKLAAHLASSRKTGCLFALLEPSTGLHASDVDRLLGCFDRLLAAGHSLVVIDNDLDIMKCADWLIELGPGGGAQGGRIVAAGTPEHLASLADSPTGRFLAKFFGQ